MHTTASDGLYAPETVVEMAIAGGLDAIAITDHDNTLGVRRAQKAAGRRIRVIPGVEISTRWQDDSIHILGYFVDPDAPVLAEHYRELHRNRHRRMEAIVERLAAQGVGLGLERVGDQRDTRAVPFTRPHLARALVRFGHATDEPDAFDRYIGNHCPAYVSVASPTPEDGIQSIRLAGGVAVWAHPPLAHLDALLPLLVEAGLQGIEALRPWSARVRNAVLDRARSAGLVVTGGSDWHGRDHDGRLGDFAVSSEEVGDFLRLGGEVASGSGEAASGSHWGVLTPREI